MEKYRPEVLEEFIGQPHLIGENGPIKRLIENNNLQSLIFYGPPGTGKTTLAQIIGKKDNATTINLNAAKSSFDELRNAVSLQKQFANVLLIIDEIHRLDKKKQDFLLPYLEHEKILIIGTTTENPYFSCSNAIRSRTLIFEFKKLEENEIAQKLTQIRSKEYQDFTYDTEVHQLIARYTKGDIRLALNYFNLLVQNYENNEITKELVVDIFQQNILIDQNSDYHYNLLSSLQKSIRASDVDAALHYFARLLKGGDYQSIFRRLLVIAYEDIGLANPQLCGRVINAIQSFERVGMPEGRIILANIVIDLSLSPKSTSAYRALDHAISDYEQKGNDEFNPYIISLQEEKYKYDPEKAKNLNLLPESYQKSRYYVGQNTSKYEQILMDNKRKQKRNK